MIKKALVVAILGALVSAAFVGGPALNASYASAETNNQDTSLASFKANGVDVTDGQVISLPQGSTLISIEALPTNDYAVAVTSANADALIPGNNDVTVTVTAYDEVTTKVYTLHVNVAAPSSDTTLDSVLVGGLPFSLASDGTSIFNAPVGTTRVSVTAVAHSNAAQVRVIGNTDLKTGSNAVSIRVQAEDGTTASYPFSVNVAAANNDTSLSSFKVNGSSVSDDDIIEVLYGTEQVSVEATANADTSTFTYSGNTDLAEGDNTVSVIVTSEAGTSTSHNVTVRVLGKSSDNSINSITVDGVQLVGDSINVASGVTQVNILVETHNGFATYSVLGNKNLEPGANPVLVVVTAQDGKTEEFPFLVNVYKPSSNSGLASIKIDGVPLTYGTSVSKPHGTSSVVVEVEPSDPSAIVVIAGESSLLSGSNTISFRITAEDGSSTSYSVTVNVALANDAGVSLITVDGVDVTGSLVASASLGASSVDVVVQTSDAEATYVVAGKTGLHGGSNNVTVTVTAADGKTSVEYVVVVSVPVLSSDASLGSLTVDDEALSPGATISRPYGTSSVVVVAAASNVNASVSVSGASGFVTGLNTVVVSVTAEDGFKRSYSFFVDVAKSSDAGVSLITVDGVDVTGSLVASASLGASSVDVVVQTSDAEATYVVAGKTGLHGGSNNVTVTVTAADGKTSVEYVVVVSVPVLSSDASLGSLTVDDEALSPGATISRPYGTSSVVVVAAASNVNASVSVSGASGFVTGLNTVVVSVTAEDGFKRSYSFFVDVAKSSDAGVSLITVDGVDVTGSLVASASLGASSVDVVVQTSDAEATYVVAGKTGLHGGSNNVTVTVTAADGKTSVEYVVVVSVPVLSSDASLGSLTVDDEALSPGATISRPYGTSSVVVVAAASNVNASVSVSGASGFVTGLNTVVVSVTAEDGFKRSYSFFVDVAKSSDAGVSLITVDGVDVTGSLVASASLGASSVDVVVQTSDAEATYVVAGKTGLHGGSNNVTVTVTAADGKTSVEYVVVVSVPVLSSDASLGSLTVDDEALSPGATISRPYGTSSVVVVAAASNVNASVSVSGASGFVTGLNTVVVSVTAEDGFKRSYSFFVDVAKSSDAGVSLITVDGVEVAQDGNLEKPFGTSSVNVSAVLADIDATYVVLGDSGLNVGANDVTVRVTAADGKTSVDYVVVVTVSPASSDADLAVFTINGVDVLAGGLVDIGSDVSSVTVVAAARSELATFEVSGFTDLVTGSNTVTVSVTAQDGSTSKVYTADVLKARAFSNDVSLASVSVNGSLVEVDGVVDVAYGTDSVDVVALTSDVNATAVVFGASGLNTGLNTLQVVVTAEDQSSRTYEFTVRVARSNDTSLLSVTVNGVSISLSDLTVTVEPPVSSVDVSAIASDADAQVSVSGNTDLSFGPDSVFVTVTAADGVTTQVYEIFVTRTAFSSDNSLASLRVNGVETEVGSVVSFEPGVSSVSVVATAVDPDASVEVLGASDLVPGENIVTVRITAADSSVADYVFTVYVRPLSDDVSLSVFTVNGEPVAAGDKVVLGGSADFVSVVATPRDINAVATVSGSTGLQFGLNTVSVTVTAESGLVETYSVVVLYPDVTDASLSVFTIDGVPVEGHSVDLPAGTSSVEVVAEATYGGEVAIDGGVDLQPGDNTLTVTVTSLDGNNSIDYVVNLKVALSADTSLAEFTVNGEDVTDGHTVEVVAGTTEVEVVAVPTDENATVEIAGQSDLQSGENTVTVTVTAADGEHSEEFTATVLVLPSGDATLSTFTVNGNDVQDGDVVDLDPYTQSVEVEAVATDENASVEVVGGAELQPGENELLVTVTAVNGDVVEYRVTLNVLYGADTSLATFTVNGNDVQDGDSVDLEYGTTEVEVEVVPTDPDATVVVEGDSGLEAGANVLTVTVTAADGEAVQVYRVVLNVLLNVDTGLGVFTVNGSDVSDGDSVELPYGTSEVDVIATPVDEDATVEVSGASGLQPGENTLTVTVTAADGETTQDYSVTLVVLANSDASLAVFAVNGRDVSDGDSVDLDPYTSEVEVVAEASDENASVEVSGATDLQPGENTLTVTVTAANGDVATYTVTLVVALSADTSLATFTVNGNDVQDGDRVDLDPYTQSVEVEAVATDENASVEVAGGTDLQPGENALTVTVTAADGETTQVYTVTLVVALSADTSLATFTVNGNDVQDGDVVDLDPYTQSVEVEAVATDENASVEVAGGTDLQPGENTLTVTVTAANGDVATYTVTLVVALSADTSLATFTVNGNDVQDGDSVDLDPYTQSVEVEAVATDENASVEVAGGTDLQPGENALTVTVTAANGDVATYTVTLVVALSADTSLATFTVNGNDVQDGDSVDLDPYTQSVEVEAVATDENASVEVAGGTDLQPGENALTVTVTAANGDVATYTVTLVVALSADTSLATFTVNGNDVQDGDSVDLDPYTQSVEVEAVATDENASVEVAGGTDLQPGENTLTVTVTAANGDVATYTVILVVALSADTSLATFTVNGNDVQDGDVVDLDPYTQSVAVEAVATDENASVEVAGGTDLQPGENTLTVTVTAANGDVATYTVLLVVALSADTSLATFTVNGNDVQDGDRVDLDPYTQSVAVEAVATDENASVEVAGGTDLQPGENALTVTVTAANGDVATYTVLLVVALSADTSLATFTVNGNDVQDGDVVDLDPYTQSVEVEAVATDENASVEVVGGAELQPGENELLVTVTAVNGDVVEYRVTLNVLYGADTSLATFTVNGNDVQDGDSVDLEYGTTEVEVEVVPTDPDATVVVEGDSGLEAGANVLTVTVTAADGEAVQVYRVVLNVLLNVDTGLGVFTVNGSDVSDGDSVELPYGTSEVDVIATPVDEDATVEVSGASGLQPGENTLTVTVTAADGETTQDYSVTLVVLANSDASLAVFAVNGSDVVDGDSVDLDPYTSEVEVVAEASDENASVEVAGATDLQPGENTLTVTVTAANGDVATYTVLLVVALSADTSLATFTVNGNDVQDGDSVDLDPYTQSVEVEAVATDENASVEVAGATDLQPGENALTVTVTAANGDVATYTVTLVVALSADTSLATFTVNGNDVQDGDRVDLDPYTQSVEVEAVATDENASVEVAGGTDLQPGENALTVTVTAANGDVATYTVTLVVALSADTSLATFTVNGNDVQDGDRVDLDPYTQSVEVEAVATDENASVEVVGGAELQPGENELLVTVTAVNGDVVEYRVTLNVLYGADTSLATFTVNGNDVQDGDSVDLEYGTTEVEVEVVPTDPDATVVVEGDSGLEAGANVLTVTVTAADGEAVQVYRVVLNVLLNVDTGLGVFTVNGSDVSDGDSVELPYGTSEVDVIATPVDEDATVEVSGASGLRPGENTLTVTVTAADGETTQDYSVTLVVLANSDASLAVFAVNGSDVVDGDSVDLDPYTSEVEVVAEASDENASVEVAGASGLQPGENTLTVTVTAADGETTQVYTVTLVVALSADTSLATFTVNGNDVQDGDRVDLDPYTQSVEVEAVATDENASVEVAGATDLQPGENVLTVTVTAADGETVQQYVVILVVALSADASLATFTVNGNDVQDGDRVDLDPYTQSVEVEAVATDENASVEVVGGAELQPGENELLVTVTAVNGDVVEYRVTLNVLYGADTSLATFTVNGNDVQDGDSVDLEYGTTEVEVEVVPTDPDATVVVEGDSGLEAGANVLTVTVTAADGEAVQVYRVVLNVLLNVDTGLGVFTVNGSDVSDGDSVELPYGTSEVDVIATPVDEDATVEVSGASGLQPGENTLTVTVTAADGETTQDYSVTLVVLANSDASLAVFAVNGSDVVDGDSVDLDPYTSEVEVVAEASDENASVEVSGASGLQPGENTLTVTVTAADGETTQVYTVTLVVALSADTSLATFTVNGNDVQDGDRVDLDPYTQSVEVEAVATDENASVEVAGATDLQPGENVLTVTVTAADGETVQQYVVILVVALSADASLATFTVNGNDVQDGDRVDLDPYTQSVEVEAVATDENASVEVVGGAELQPGENELLVTVTAVNGDVVEYRVTLNVLYGADTSLATFTVNGNDVQDGDSVDLEYGTTEVEVEVVPTDPDATVVVEGDSGLEAGANVLTVTVTAADGEAVQVYRVVLNVLLNVDTGLGVFTVNGSDVSDGDSVELPYGTSEVDVIATPVDEDATVEVSGASGLQPGENTLTVTVTAADGETTQDYSVTLVVLANSDASLAVFAVNGSDVVDGDSVDLDPYTSEVEVVAEASDENATVEVAGATDLQPGENTLTVTVTAADGETTQVYTVTLVVALSADTSLATFTVNGNDVQDGDIVDLDPYTQSVEVEAVATDENASVEVAGATDLQPGENALTVTVTAADGETVQQYVVILNVLLGDNVLLDSFTVNGNDVQDGDRVDLEYGTTEVEVEVITSDPDATVVVDGASDLQTGENTLTVTVTAANGENTAVYTVLLIVALNSDASLATFTVNGSDVADGDSVDLEYGTTEVDVEAVATDENASVEVVGGTDLQTGENTLTVTVTAADGETTAVYTVLLIVALNSDASLATFTVNGNDVQDGDSVDLEYGTTEVEVEAVATDENASVEVVGATDLQPGENTLTVTVTAANGETTQVYTVTLVVALNNDTSVQQISVNGVIVAENGTFRAPENTTSVTVEVTTTDPDASAEVSGNEDLVFGELNEIVITVTAADGETVAEHKVYVYVPLSSDTGILEILVNGDSVKPGEVLRTLDRDLIGTDADIEVTTSDANATVEVFGNTQLVERDNLITIVVTAANGDSKTYTVTYRIGGLSGNANLKSLFVAGQAISLDNDTATLNVSAALSYVNVLATAEESAASIVVSGNKSLGFDPVLGGTRQVQIKVTAPDGKTIKTYLVVLVATGLSTNTNLKSLTVNGVVVKADDTVTLVAGAGSASVVAVPEDSGATVRYVVPKLVLGVNTAQIIVTAASGSSATYSLKLVVPALSNDTSLKSFTIEGFDVLDKSKIFVQAGTTKLHISAKANNSGASIMIFGRDITSGLNTVTVRVTAANGEFRDYVVKVSA